MPNILHRLSIDAPPERVHQLAATREGIQQWWTGHPVAGDDKIGGQLSVYFPRTRRRRCCNFSESKGAVRNKNRPRCVNGPQDWIDTRITFLRRSPVGRRKPLPQPTLSSKRSITNGCSTNWGAYLTSLKSELKWSLQRLPGRRDQPLGLKHRAPVTPGPVAGATSSNKVRTRARHMI